MRWAILAIICTAFVSFPIQAGDAPTGLTVGFAEADITPKLDGNPVYLAGFGNNRKATGVHDPLKARAVVLGDGQVKIALIAVDLVGFFHANVLSVRRQLPEFHYVLVNSTHNHEGPDTLGLWGPTTPLPKSGIDPAYVQLVEKQIVQAVRDAAKIAQPGTARIGVAKAPELLHDGRQPYVKHDDLVVLEFKGAGGKPLGLMVQWNCHPETLGSKNTLVSADYVGYTVDAIGKQHGCPVAYFTGTVGGLMTSLSVPIKDEKGTELKDGTYEKTERYGLLLAEKVERALAAARPLNLTPISVRSRQIFVPMTNRLYQGAQLLGVLDRPSFLWTGDPYQAEPASKQDSDKPQCIRSEVAILRLGDLEAVAIPGEIYPELVLDQVQDPVDPGADFPDAPVEPALYKQLKAAHKMIFGLANDEIGYLLPKRQWDEKPPFCYGRTKPQYGETNSVGPDAGPIICRAIKELAETPHAGGLRAVPFQDVKINDSFWSPRLETNRTVTALANIRQCELTGRLKNFAVAGKLEKGKHQGYLFNDSDVYKVLEGIAYALANQPDPELEKRADAVIEQIAAAQQPDGYLNTYCTLVKPKERWQNTAHGHEMYCAGHLIEAGIAYQQATGKSRLLEVARRFADHICGTFGPDKRLDVCGHEEIELALIKLHRATGEKKYLDQAKFFLETRGRGEKRKLFGEYSQDHKPIREQREVVGHAVRAMYLYCAIADLAAITGDQQLIRNLETIWDDVVQRKMYITGGIGSSASNEGFTQPYDLPNESAYAETCAAIGLALWSQRMFLLTRDGKYADLVEREAYNGLLSGVSLSGDRFFYTNPLASKAGAERVPWFACACCPPNVLRYIAGIGERVYAHDDHSIYTLLYMGNETTIPLKGGKVKLKQATTYPWTDSIFITVEPEKSFEFELCLRVPGWSKEKAFIRVLDAKGNHAGRIDESQIEKGYLKIRRTWSAGDRLNFKLPVKVERVHADAKVKADIGRAAIQRGPIIYCLEGLDNDGQVRNLCLPPETKDWAQSFKKDLLGGITVVRGEAQSVSRGKDGELVTSLHVFTAIPYCTWANRGKTPMVVWIPEKPELAEPK